VILYPAIDLLAGRAVRLRQGKFDDVTVYSDRPWDLAASWAQAGATILHVVDLDAARGMGTNADVVARIRESAGLPVQLGGGIRSAQAARRAIDAGADRVVLGTVAVRDPTAAEAICAAHPGRVVVAVDAREGKVAVAGWTEASEISPADLGRRASAWGAAALLYTDVSRDGLETGPDLPGTRALAQAIEIPVLASGGVSSLADLRALATIRPALLGAIVGRALLEGRFSVADAVRILQ